MVGGSLCCTPGCRNRYGGSSHISFFKIPSDLERKKKWIEILEIDPKDVANISDPKICSDHFKANQFTSRNRVWLKRTAIPFSFKSPLPSTPIVFDVPKGQPASNVSTLGLRPLSSAPSKGAPAPSKRIITTPKTITPLVPVINLEHTPSAELETGISSESGLQFGEDAQATGQVQLKQSNQWILLGTNGKFVLQQVPTTTTYPQTETACASTSGVTTIPGNKEDIGNVTYYLSSLATSTPTLVSSSTTPQSSVQNIIQFQPFDPARLCLMCNGTCLTDMASKDPYLLRSTRTIITDFVKILNLDSCNFTVEESIPFCLNCVRHAKLLVNSYNELLDLQERFKKLKADVLQALVSSFCQRKAMVENEESVRGFYQDSKICTEMIDKLLESNSENSLDSTPSSQEKSGELHVHKNVGESQVVGNAFEDHNFEMDIISGDESENVPEQPGHDPQIEICFNGKTGTHRMKKKWEALSSCAETAPGLEKLLPFHLRRVTCPICQEKIPSLRISRHLASHPAEEKRGVVGLKKLVSDSTEIVKGKMRRKLITEKWRALVKSSGQKDGMDSHVPIQCRRIKCPTCNKEIGLAYLASHLNTHTGEKPYKCSQCPKSFAGKSNLVSHRSVHANKAPLKFNTYFCDFCEKGKKLQFRSNYVKHIFKTHASIVGATDVLYFFKCDFDGCLECYRDRDQFLQHLTTHNEEGITFACPYLGCQKIFASSLNCETHLAQLHAYSEIDTNTESTLFDCKFCPKVCGSEKEWIDHELTHGIDMSTEQREHLCEECGKGFKTKLQLWAHKHNGRVHANTSKPVQIRTNSKPTVRNRRHKYAKEHNAKASPYSPNCQFCEKRITSRKSMINHLLDTHTYENKLNCYICNQDFKKLARLESHIRRHLGLPRKSSRQKCIYCGEEFPYIIALREHCFKKHYELYLAEKPFYCPLCWSRFENQEDVTAHHMKFHEQWKCKICGKQLMNRTRFEDHTRIHTGEAPFPCHLCPKAFRMRVNLNEHIMRHNGEKPFYCILCPTTKTGFFRKKMLRNHMENVHSILDENVISFSISETVALGAEGEQQFEVLEIMDVDVGVGE